MKSKRVKQTSLLERTLHAASDNRKGEYSHYKVLDIASTFISAEIKRTYLKLVLRLHPDKNHMSKADEALKAISSTYEVLKDETIRNTMNCRDVTVVEVASLPLLHPGNYHPHIGDRSRGSLHPHLTRPC